MDGSLDRRSFLSTGIGLAAALAPSGIGATVPTDRIGLGLIRCGVRGTYILGEALAAGGDGVDVVALCDVWSLAREKLAQDLTAKTGRKAPRLVARYEDLLSTPGVDAVIVTTPDFAHPGILVDAVKAGKDVYVEKPLCARLEDAAMAYDVVTASNRIVQVGTQRRSSPRFLAGYEYVTSGALGSISKIETAWNRNVPSWLRPLDTMKESDVDWAHYRKFLSPRPFDPVRLRSWQWFYENTTGLVGLLGSHLIDVAQWFMDDPYPTSAVALGGQYVWKDGREISDTAEYIFEYPKGWLLTFSSRLGSGPETDYTVFRGRTRSLDTRDWTSRPADNARPADAQDVVLPAPPKAEGSLTTGDAGPHVANWIDCMRSRKAPHAPIAVGYSHAVACCLAREAERTGQRMRYDPAGRQIVRGESN